MSVLTSEPDWQRRRSLFNHDRLKNKYLPALSTFLNILDDKIEDDEFERSFVADTFPGWELRHAEVTALIHDFESEMSPRNLLDRSWRTPDKSWLSRLVDILWHSRYPVAEWLSEAQDAARQTNESYLRLCRELEKSRDIEQSERLRQLRDDFARFRNGCQDLAISIEKFPRKILVT